MGSPKLTNNTNAAKLLKSKFQSGALSGDEKPKDVYLSENEFQKFKLTAFRNKFHTFRKLYGQFKLSDSGDDGLNRLYTGKSKIEPSDFKAREVSALSDEIDMDDIGTRGHELIVTGNYWKPIYLVSQWQEPKTRTKCISGALLLPSGVGADDFNVRIDSAGENIEVTMNWPEPLLNVELLHKFLVDNGRQTGFKLFHPKVGALEDALRHHRQRATDNVVSTTKIPLPFRVLSHIVEQENFAWTCSRAMVIDLDLTAEQDRYAFENNKKTFIVS